MPRAAFTPLVGPGLPIVAGGVAPTDLQDFAGKEGSKPDAVEAMRCLLDGAGRGRALDSGSLLFPNLRMASLKRMAAMGAALLLALALALVGVTLHEHATDVQGAAHADCDGCHFRHLPGVEPGGSPAPSTPDLVAHAVVSACPDGERSVALGASSTRGPPA